MHPLTFYASICDKVSTLTNFIIFGDSWVFSNHFLGFLLIIFTWLINKSFLIYLCNKQNFCHPKYEFQNHVQQLQALYLNHLKFYYFKKIEIRPVWSFSAILDLWWPRMTSNDLKTIFLQNLRSKVSFWRIICLSNISGQRGSWNPRRSLKIGGLFNYMRWNYLYH